MERDSTKRFSSRVADYVRYRPSYPPQTLPWLAAECGLTPQAVVADIGSGTGFFAALFLRFGCHVLGIEPNREMREAGESFLAGEPRFTSVDGRAEATGLADHSVDFVTAGQAFHWFDRPAARREFARILRPAGWVVLAWNERLVDSPFLEAYEATLIRYSPDYQRVDHRQVDAGVMDGFFGAGRWKQAAFPNEQRFDLQGVMGRLHSSSYAPPPGSDAYRLTNDEVKRSFAEYHQEGSVTFRYLTRIYAGTL